MLRQMFIIYIYINILLLILKLPLSVCLPACVCVPLTDAVCIWNKIHGLPTSGHCHKIITGTQQTQKKSRCYRQREEPAEREQAAYYIYIYIYI